MPIHDRGKSRRLRLEIKLLQIMQNVNREACDFQNIRRWKLSCPSTFIHIPADTGNGGDLAQPLQNGGVADISRMNDPLRTRKRFNRLWPKQSMSVGDNADYRHVCASGYLCALCETFANFAVKSC